ncbi:MAG: hypothetical protein ACLR6I_18290 [Waltera sp.]
MKRELKNKKSYTLWQAYFSQNHFPKDKQRRKARKQLYQRVVAGRMFDILCRNIHNKIQDKSKGKRKEKAAWN